MAVAPLNQVRRVVEYALTQIPAEKIDLGIPNYGYDWPLPFERGVTKAATINNVQAVRIAVEHGAEIQFDMVAESPFFTYVEDGETAVIIAAQRGNNYIEGTLLDALSLIHI